MFTVCVGLLTTICSYLNCLLRRFVTARNILCQFPAYLNHLKITLLLLQILTVLAMLVLLALISNLIKIKSYSQQVEKMISSF